MLGLMDKKDYRELKELVVNGFAKVDKDYKELADFLGGRISHIEEVMVTKTDLEGVKTDLGGVKADMEGMKIDMEEMKEDLAKVVAQTHDMTKTLDAQSKYFQEQEMIKVQIKRHEGWIDSIAKDTGTKLEY